MINGNLYGFSTFVRDLEYSNTTACVPSITAFNFVKRIEQLCLWYESNALLSYDRLQSSFSCLSRNFLCSICYLNLSGSVFFFLFWWKNFSLTNTRETQNSNDTQHKRLINYILKPKCKKLTRSTAIQPWFWLREIWNLLEVESTKFLDILVWKKKFE